MVHHLIIQITVQTVLGNLGALNMSDAVRKNEKRWVTLRESSIV